MIEPRRASLAAQKTALIVLLLQLEFPLFQRALSSCGGRKGWLEAWAFVFIRLRVRRGRRSLDRDN